MGLLPRRKKTEKNEKVEKPKKPSAAASALNKLRSVFSSKKSAPKVTAPQAPKAPAAKPQETKAPEIKVPEIKAKELKNPEVKAKELKNQDVKIKDLGFKAQLAKIKELKSSRPVKAEKNTKEIKVEKTEAVKKPAALSRKLKSMAELDGPSAEETKKVAAPSMPRTQLPQQRELPDNYGDNQIYLLVRDPYWIYAYWEIQKDHETEALAKVGGSWDGVTSILRVFDTTEGTNTPPFFDIILQNMVRYWYVNVQPNHSYVVEIGLLHRDGRYACLARSNQICTPRSGMSEIVDEKWMGVDWEKIYALSGGFQVGKSSAELRELMEERLRKAITSGSGAGAVSSLSSPVKIEKRGFFFWLECELIIYGGTEPDAAVTMQGRPVKLRPDGTFTLRYGLPDGKFVFDCHAHSADGVEERVITPIVGRSTERPAPIFKKAKKK